VLLHSDLRLERFSQALESSLKAKKDSFFRDLHPVLCNGFVPREEYMNNVYDALCSDDRRFVEWAEQQIEHHYAEAL